MYTYGRGAGLYMYRWRRLLSVYAEEEKVVIYAHGEGLYTPQWRRSMDRLRRRRRLYLQVEKVYVYVRRGSRFVYA